jgi:hypothetical protein
MRFHTLATREKDRLRARGPPSVGLAGLFSGRGILESDNWLLLLADYYNRTTLAGDWKQRPAAHRSFLLRAFP